MIIDHENLFSDEQAVTATAASENIIDLGTDRDIGNGEPLEVLVSVGETFTAAGAATLTVSLQTDDNASFSSPTTLVSSPALALAELDAGSQVFRYRVPYGTERYLRLNYAVGTGPMTAGNVTSGLILDRQAYRSYPNGYTVE